MAALVLCEAFCEHEALETKSVLPSFPSSICSNASWCRIRKRLFAGERGKEGVTDFQACPAKQKSAEQHSRRRTEKRTWRKDCIDQPRLVMGKRSGP